MDFVKENGHHKNQVKLKHKDFILKPKEKAENILELVKDINPWTQKNLQFSSSINKKKLTPTHCTVKLQKIKENLKSQPEGKL